MSDAEGHGGTRSPQPTIVLFPRILLSSDGIDEWPCPDIPAWEDAAAIQPHRKGLHVHRKWPPLNQSSTQLPSLSSRKADLHGRQLRRTMSDTVGVTAKRPQGRAWAGSTALQGPKGVWTHLVRDQTHRCLSPRDKALPGADSGCGSCWSSLWAAPDQMSRGTKERCVFRGLRTPKGELVHGTDEQGTVNSAQRPRQSIWRVLSTARRPVPHLALVHV